MDNNIKFNIVLYTLCWNEIDILPFVIDYWKRLGVSKAVVYDNGSTDGSVEFLKKYDWIEIRYFETDGMNDDVQRNIKNDCWGESKGIADFVIVCDMDEVLFSDNLNEELSYMKEHDFNILGTDWIALCGDKKPEYDNGKLLHEIINVGYKQVINTKYPHLGKLMLFDPNKVDKMNYEVGCHSANPIPSSRIYESKKIFAIHFDKGFGSDYTYEKRSAMYKRLSQVNKSHGWCFQYGYSKEKMVNDYNENVSKSFNILEYFKNAG